MISWLIRDLRERTSRWVLGLFCLFMFFPGLDIWASGLFFIPGTGFTWDGQGFMEFVRAALPVLILGTFVFCIVLWVAGIWYERWFWGITTNRAVYLMTTLLVGPGLLVNALLKPNWGRARPKDITLFGGAESYTPPLWVADACERNCSFVSGHAAIAFWVTAYAFLLPPKWRLLGVLAGTLFGAAVGLVRIAQGAHFLSDVMFAGVIVLWVNYALYRVVILRAFAIPGLRMPEPKIPEPKAPAAPPPAAAPQD